jgi:hypothetical protein
MISLSFSQKGQPFIDLGEHGQLIFSKLTAHPEKGYKYFAYVHRFVDEFLVKNMTTGERTIKQENAFNSYMFNMHFKRNEKGDQGVPSGTIPRKAVQKLSMIIDQFLTEDTWLPRRCIPMLSDAIDSVNWDKLLQKRKPRIKNTKRKKK